MKIGILSGEIPPPHFIHQLVCNIAGRNHKVFLYGSLVEKKMHYNDSSIIIRAKPSNNTSILPIIILLITKLIYIYRLSSFQLLSQIWSHDKKISTFIKRCSVVLPPFIDNLDIFHNKQISSLVLIKSYFLILTN